MNLSSFFPYRLAVLAEAVSQSVALVYGSRFALSREEWRVIAALADKGVMRNVHMVDCTTLDKMQVSRAVARLETKGMVAREPDPEDGRGHVLRILPAGRALVRKIVPMVLAREQFLLEDLDDAERAVLDRVLAKVLARARALGEQG